MFSTSLISTPNVLTVSGPVNPSSGMFSPRPSRLRNRSEMGLPRSSSSGSKMGCPVTASVPVRVKRGTTRLVRRPGSAAPDPLWTMTVSPSSSKPSPPSMMTRPLMSRTENFAGCLNANGGGSTSMACGVIVVDRETSRPRS